MYSFEGFLCDDDDVLFSLCFLFRGPNNGTAVSGRGGLSFPTLSFLPTNFKYMLYPDDQTLARVCLTTEVQSIADKAFSNIPGGTTVSSLTSIYIPS